MELGSSTRLGLCVRYSFTQILQEGDFKDEIQAGTETFSNCPKLHSQEEAGLDTRPPESGAQACKHSFH